MPDSLIDNIERLINDYVRCWSTGQNRFSSPQIPTGIDSPSLILSNNFTPCEENYLVFLKKYNAVQDKIEWRYPAHGLAFEVIRRLPIYFTRTLRAQTVNFDHRVLWSWIGQLLIHCRTGLRKPDTLLGDAEFVDNFLLLVRLELASLGAPPIDQQTMKLNRIIHEIVSYHVQEVINHKNVIGLALSFPVLERALKLRCSEYVNPDGLVVRDFNVQRSYVTENTISSVRDLLRLFRQEVASVEMQKHLDDFTSELSSIFPNAGDVFELIYSWRNSIVHGQSMQSQYHAVIMNLLSMIILDSLSPTYDDIKGIAERSFSRRVVDFKSPLDIYPPDLF